MTSSYLFDFMGRCWPKMYVYVQQREIVQSVEENDETIVRAGNMLGKDYISARIAIAFFMTRHPCRVVTTSVDGEQLSKVLWGEIGQAIQESEYELPFVVNHMDIRKIVKGQVCPRSYLTGRVASKENKGAGLLGHHLPRGPFGEPCTLALIDECSAFSDDYYEKMQTWAHRTLAIGNPFDCQNFFRRYSKQGDVARVVS